MLIGLLCVYRMQVWYLYRMQSAVRRQLTTTPTCGKGERWEWSGEWGRGGPDRQTPFVVTATVWGKKRERIALWHIIVECKQSCDMGLECNMQVLWIFCLYDTVHTFTTSFEKSWYSRFIIQIVLENNLDLLFLAYSSPSQSRQGRNDHLIWLNCTILINPNEWAQQSIGSKLSLLLEGYSAAGCVPTRLHGQG